MHSVRFHAQFILIVSLVIMVSSNKSAQQGFHSCIPVALWIMMIVKIELVRVSANKCVHFNAGSDQEMEANN